MFADRWKTRLMSGKWTVATADEALVDGYYIGKKKLYSTKIVFLEIRKRYSTIICNF